MQVSSGEDMNSWGGGRVGRMKRGCTQVKSEVG